jgi:hypothetical protein
VRHGVACSGVLVRLGADQCAAAAIAPTPCRPSPVAGAASDRAAPAFPRMRLTMALSCSGWFWRLQRRAQVLRAVDRSNALQALASRLSSHEPLAAAVALLTVAGVFPRSWPERVAMAEQVLADGNTIDEVLTALVFWCDRGRRGGWIAQVLKDPTAAQRHAARRRGYLHVGREEAWHVAGIGELLAAAAAAADISQQCNPPDWPAVAR